MAWSAKPSGAYAINSAEALGNMDMIYAILSARGWTVEAVSGMCGNINNESGFNPWRWQSDSVNYSMGYGLVQFTPASGYFNSYGVGVSGFSPNASTTSVTAGATPDDGTAQMIVVDEDRAGKFINRSSQCSYADISSVYPMSAFKATTDLWLATVGWLFHYEAPADKSYSVAQARYVSAQAVYQYLSGHEPPDPPEPPTPGHLAGAGLKIWQMIAYQGVVY